MDAEDIELASDWDGADGEFCQSLVEVGFIDQTESGYILHDWVENNPWVSEAENRQDESRFNALKRWNPKLAKELEEKGITAISKAELATLKAGTWHPHGTHIPPNGGCNAPDPIPDPSNNSSNHTPTNNPCARKDEDPVSGVGGGSPSSPPPVLDEPPIEFQELRCAWDNYARSEEPLSGLDEYWQLKHSKQWPGNGRIMAAMERLKEQDQQWIRGFVPGLAKFLRLRGWLKEPDTKARSPATGGKSSPDEVLDYNAKTSQKILEERRARASAENHCP